MQSISLFSLFFSLLNLLTTTQEGRLDRQEGDAACITVPPAAVLTDDDTLPCICDLFDLLASLQLDFSRTENLQILS